MWRPVDWTVGSHPGLASKSAGWHVERLTVASCRGQVSSAFSRWDLLRLQGGRPAFFQDGPLYGLDVGLVTLVG